MQYGKLLRMTRKAAGFTQTEMADRLFCDASSISKLESDSQALFFSRAIKWMAIVNRKDLVIAMLSDLETEQIVKFLFEKEYLGKVRDSDLFKNLNEELTIEDVENIVLNKTQEVVEWKKYLLELTGA